MAKSVHDDVLDGAHNVVKNNATKLVACSAEPTTFNEANSTYKLGEVTIASGDMTIANGDTSGRKITFAQKTGGTISANGTANHVAALDVANSKLLLVTTATAQALTIGNPLTFNSFKGEIRDPT